MRPPYGRLDVGLERTHDDLACPAIPLNTGRTQTILLILERTGLW